MPPNVLNLRTAATLTHGIITSFRVAAGPYPRLSPAAVTPAASANATKRLRWVPIVLLVLALVVAGGTTVQAALVGHSGATAVWSEDM